MRILFAGTPEFAVPALAALIGRPETRPVAVLTQPDRPAGRGRKLAASPVKRAALDAGIEVLQPARLKSAESREPIAALEPHLIITAAYGLLLPKAVLDLPAMGCWNLHASLLPRWRGASPIHQAILAGDQSTGISLMQMDTGLDTGPVILRRETAIGAEETAGELHDRLAVMAAEVLVEALDLLEQGRLPAPMPQDDALATHAPLIAKSDARMDWQMPAERLARMVRAYQPWPVAFGELAGEPVRVHRARALAGQSGQPAGIVVPADDGRLVVQCGEGQLEILELQAPGRKPVLARDWLNAHPDWR